jgi:hypothetical protein
MRFPPADVHLPGSVPRFFRGAYAVGVRPARDQGPSARTLRGLNVRHAISRKRYAAAGLLGDTA